MSSNFQKYTVLKKLDLKVVLLFFLLTPFIYSQVTPLNVIFTSDSTKTDTNYSIIYPKVGMGTGTVYGSNDWTYNDPTMYVYMVVSGTQSFMGCDIKVRWDTSMVSNILAKSGDLFTSFYFDTIRVSANTIRINISSLAGNVAPQLNKHLIKFMLKLKKPGKNVLEIVDPLIRYYDVENDIQYDVPLNLRMATIKFYPGDFATSRTILNTGDGQVNFHDAAIFGRSYNTAVGNPQYRVKFDIAPTPDTLLYWELPISDGIIDFSDLTLFTVGYINQGRGRLAFKEGTDNLSPGYLSFGSLTTLSSNIKLPIILSGNSTDIRTLSVTLICDDNYYEYSGFESTNNFFIAGSRNGKNVTIDAASFDSGISLTGNIVYIVFKEKKQGTGAKDKIKIVDATAFNSSGNKVNVNIK